MEYSVMGEMTKRTEKTGSTQTLYQTNDYNQDGQRIKRTQDGTERSYFYDSGVVLYTKDGSTISSANILSDSGAAIGTYRGSTYHTYLKDIQGSTTNLVKSDGSLSAAYDYTDFGETTELAGAGYDNQIRYTGGIYDEETGLYYLNARYYDPETGRFISQDSYRGEIDDSGQWHLYAYCANNPINYVDPSGHARYSKYKKTSSYAFWYRPPNSGVKCITFTIWIKWSISNKKIEKGSIQSSLTLRYDQPTRRHTWRYYLWSRDISLGRTRYSATHTAKVMVENINTGLLRSCKVVSYIYGTGKCKWYGPFSYQ